MKRLIMICAVFVLPVYLHAQQKQISGVLTNKAGKPVANITVLLTNAAGNVINFANSNGAGLYRIPVDDTAKLDWLYLEINSLGYKKWKQQLAAGKYNWNVLLEEKFIDLPEVKVKSRPVIESKGDTLSYNVSSFSREEDRSIGDVIRRLPGVTVAENGQVSYNGKPIANLYIHGDDLMNGRYGLATKTITKEMIKTVDILLNHQPIKVLQNKVFTDNVAMNLVLKDENSLKLSGQAMLGAGLPQQFDAAFNTMLFNKKFKMLNSLKTNNSGIDYRDEFNQYGSSNFLNNVGNSRPPSLLSAGTAGNPDLPRSNYYINKTAVLNTNNLVNTKRGLQLRSNIQLFLDRNTFNYNSAVENYFTGDTIRYTEWQHAIRKPYIVNTSFSAMVNKVAYFFNNNLSLNFSGENSNSHMDFNGKAFDQRLKDRTHSFSNDLNFTPAIGKKDVVNIRWYLNHYNGPQHLYIGSGLNSDILNNSVPYAAINQQANTPAFFSNISASYRFSGPQLIKQNYEVGVVNERQQLNSQLYLTQNDGSIDAYAADAGNALHWLLNRAYLNAGYDYRKDRIEANLSIPFNWQYIRYYQQAYALNHTDRQFFVNPVARFKIYVKAEDYLLINYSYKNNTGNIAGVYRGAVLGNYRSLSANDAELQQKNTSGSGIYYNFQRSIIMLFINAGISYSKVTANSILSTILTDNVQRTVLLPYENDQRNMSVTAGISKYLFGLSTTASLNAMYNRGRSNQFINDQQLPFISNGLSLTAGLESKFFRVVTLSYRGSGNWNTSKQNAAGVKLSTAVKRFDQQIVLGYSPVKNLFLNIKARHIYSTQASASAINYVFADTKIRYKLIKWRTDLEMDITNIAGITNYKVFMLSANQFAYNQYEIRGRMAILRATFNL